MYVWTYLLIYFLLTIIYDLKLKLLKVRVNNAGKDFIILHLFTSWDISRVNIWDNKF